MRGFSHSAEIVHVPEYMWADKLIFGTVDGKNPAPVLNAPPRPPAIILKFERKLDLFVKIG